MPRPHHVTHHALLRYLERVRGFKFDRERAEIQRIVSSCGQNGTVKFEGHSFEVKNGAVITVAPINEKQTPNRTKREDVRARLG